jgi:PfaD family protein
MRPFDQQDKKALGWWTQGKIPPVLGDDAIKAAVHRVTSPIFLLCVNDQLAIGRGGSVHLGDPGFIPSPSDPESYPILAYAPPLHPMSLGDPHFKQSHDLSYAYVIGAMANGISSVEMVEQAGRGGMLGFFGAAGLTIQEIDSAINQLQQRMDDLPFGFNLIHSPNEPELESATAALYLQRGVKLVSASAYLDLTLPLVHFRTKGIHRNNEGHVICPNKVIAKVSRIEVAKKFFSPPPSKLLKQLVAKGMLSEQEALLSESVPMAHYLTAEADSGGHTDNQSAISLLPTMRALRDEMADKFQYTQPLGVGLAGGIATPDSAAAAFAMGADYILTGSINQACIEAGTSETVRYMLMEASQADVTMAPSADMFEMGVKVQVLKRGTMFPFRAARLYDLFCRYNTLEEIPNDQRVTLEREFFRHSFEEEWERTRVYFYKRDPVQIQRAESDPKHKMALVFRSYLGRSSSWANAGEPSRKIDYQIWCGPAMGAFNQWVRGSFLEKPDNRRAVTVAMNLLYGAAVITRVNWIRSQGVPLPASLRKSTPFKLSDIERNLQPEGMP